MEETRDTDARRLAIGESTQRGDVYAGGSDELARYILGNKILLVSYAVAIIILSVGLVLLTAMAFLLMFFMPEKANAVIMLVAVPLIGLCIGHTVKLSTALQISNKEERKEVARTQSIRENAPKQ